MKSLLETLGRFPVEHPWLVVLLALLSSLPAAHAARLLPVRTGLSELLPESRPSVIELRRTSRRLEGVSTLVVLVEGKNTDSLRSFVDELAPLIRGLGPGFVVGVDEGRRAARRFVKEHKLLYADRAEIEALREDVVARYDWEAARKAGLDLEIAEPPPPITAESIRARFGKDIERAKSELGEGYYLGEDGRLAAILVRTPFESADPRAFDLERRIRELSTGTDASRSDRSLRIWFTGDLVTSAEEHRVITTDLAHVGTTGVALILAAVFLFFLRIRILVVLTLTIGTALLWSFAVAFLAIGHLNSATGFLVSIIAGNGINFGIILGARYLESRSRDALGVREAVMTALRSSAPGTLTAAVCASVAYGSLAATDFRGFRHFGVIGGAGMLLCWLASYTLLPALLVLGERFLPLREDPRSLPHRFRAVFGRPFVLLSSRFPRPLQVLGALTGALALLLSLRYLSSDPLEYDLTRLRNDDRDPMSARALSRRIPPSVDPLTREGRALLADRLDQVKPLVEALRARRAAAPPGQEPFERVISVFDLLPQDQAEKISAIEQIVDRIRRARKLRTISDADWQKIEPELPAGLRELRIEDLPSDMIWPFRETDGSVGRMVYLLPTKGRSLNDAHYLMQWADSFREVPLPSGEVIRGSGHAVIYSDMLQSVRGEAPKAMGLSVAGTLLVILAAFRGRGTGRLALGSVLIGIVWLVGLMAVAGMRINFLSFIALPISVGVGADYAVNVLKRYEEARPIGEVVRGITETGGAVVLCSLTTLLGYGVLTLSINGAVRSFGVVAASGEVTMLLAAMLVLPAVLLSRPRAHMQPQPDSSNQFYDRA